MKEDIKSGVTDLNNDSKENKTNKDKENNARDYDKDIFNIKQEKNNDRVEVGS